jgi:hypothetical protein
MCYSLFYVDDIALMMKATSTSETLVKFYRITRRENPEDSNFHSRRREKLKSHHELLCSIQGGKFLTS